MGLNWPLTGRVEELRFVDAVVRRGAGNGVVLAGAAGVGKTRLAREALAAAARRHAGTVWIAATASARAVPLGAFATVLTEVSGDVTQLLRRATEVLTGAGRGGVVVGVDDAHLLDALSASLVHQFALRRIATLVLTVRSGEPAPDAVTALWKDGHLDRLEVQPLSEAETVALLEAVLGGPVDSASAARLWTLCRGNALYLRQLVDGEVAGGGLREVRGVWRWSGHPALSPGLADLVTTRMGRLSGAVRDVVDVLALGEPLGVPLLGALTSAAGVERAEAEGLVVVEPDGRRLEARLAHPLYGEVRREALGVLRARRLRGRIARALEDTGARRADDTMRRAVLVLESDLDPDPRLHTLAAQRAIALLDVPLAARLAQAAVDAGGGFEAQLTLGFALSWMTRGDEAEAQLSALAPLATDDFQRSLVAVPRAGNLFFSCRRPADAEAVLDRAEAGIDRPEALAPILAIRALFRALGGRSREAVEVAAAAQSGALPPHAILLVAWAVVGALGPLGRAGELERAAAPGYAAAERSFDAVVPSFGLCSAHLLGLRLAGDLRGVEDIARTRYRQGAEIPGPLQLLGVALLGYAALYRGRLGTAIRRLREAEAGLGPVRQQGPGYSNLVALTQALAMSGEAGEAAVALAAAEEERHPSAALFDPELVLARAWVRAAEGSVSSAIQVAREAADLAAARGQPAFEVFALHVAVCFGDRTAAPRLTELAEQVDGPRAAAAATQATALAGDDADALLAVSRALEDMGEVLAAADAAAQAAATHWRAGRTAAARAAATRAHQLAEACEGARTPALAAAEQPLPLTDREREIVTLAARGLSNREIADRLVVSVRTVEGHLYRASTKLGVTERTAFAALLGI
ncbi:helix-turn-helix transcriptional regulator [Amycolatopsis deserti]|uniref:helix-turn-helix transcriptional regulator n=1 Tax=Amycolatopsis deserti TaxID=185696 RepID=UPI0017481B20|nr:LuxR family transcriptional regulator [Amycolatopsis deserti]